MRRAIEKCVFTLVSLACALGGPAALAEEAAPTPPPAAPPAEVGPATAPAGTEAPFHRLDLGATVGINNPGGLYGVEADYRLLDRLSVGLSAGNAAWGPRLSVQARAYPFQVQNLGLFVELGASLNAGRTSSLEVNGATVQEVDLLPTPTANVAVGWRKQIRSAGWLALRAGYGFRLLQDNYRVRDGSELNPLLGLDVGLSQPGGILVGISGGFSVL